MTGRQVVSYYWRSSGKGVRAAGLGVANSGGAALQQRAPRSGATRPFFNHEPAWAGGRAPRQVGAFARCNYDSALRQPGRGTKPAIAPQACMRRAAPGAYSRPIRRWESLRASWMLKQGHSCLSVFEPQEQLPQGIDSTIVLGRRVGTVAPHDRDAPRQRLPDGFARRAQPLPVRRRVSRVRVRGCDVCGVWCVVCVCVTPGSQFLP
jgi:hypothetical protein